MVQALLVAVGLLLARAVWQRGLVLDGEAVLGTLFVLILSCEVLALLFRGINLGQHHITAYNVSMLLQRLCYLAGVIALGVAKELRLATVLGAWLVAAAVKALGSGIWIWRRPGVASRLWGEIPKGWGSSLVRGLRALLTVILTLVLVRTDVYMLGPMLGMQAVGQISVASALAEYLWYIPSILSSVLFAAAAASRGPETVTRISRASRFTVAIVAPLALVLMFVGRLVVPLLYGQAYAQAGTLFVLLLPGMLAISLHLVIDSYFAGSGFPPITYATAAGALVMKIALNLTLVPRLEIEGAAVATSVVYALVLLVKTLAFTRLTGASLRSLFLPTRADLTSNLAAARTWIQEFRRRLADRPA
jgi:O-antigen/teichoic acid export membrane protein